MRRLLTRLAVIVLLTALLPMGAGADDAAVKREIRAQYALLAKRYKQKDFMAFVSCTTPDVRLYQILGGRISRAELGLRMQRLKTEVKSVESATLTVTKLTVKEREKEAVAEVTLKATFTRQDPDGDFGKKGKIHHISNTIVSRDAWIKNGAEWKMKASEQLSHKRQVDGKPLDPTPTPPQQD